MSDFISTFLVALASVPFWATLFGRRSWHIWWHYILWLSVMGIGINAALSLIPGQRVGAAGAIVAELAWLAIWLWHHTRTRRKRAAELLGAKTKALRDKVVRKAREALQPRPVLQPVPARW